MGTVYLAHSRGGRAVAIKVARPELASQPLFRERFRAEVEAARKVGGFHTAPVVDADPDAEVPWLATAYILGPTLSQLIADQGPMGTRQLRRLGAALAEALQAVHGCGLVHRDLKPGNIIMAEDGPRVLDFGIARALETAGLTLTGTAFGTPGFLAPEQAEGHPVGPAADVFALGAVLVAAAGGSAFGGGTPVSLMYRSVHHPSDLTAVPAPLRGILAACLEKTPEHRPSTTQLLTWLPTEDPREADYPSASAGAANTTPAPSGAAGAAARYSPTIAAPSIPPRPRTPRPSRQPLHRRRPCRYQVVKARCRSRSSSPRTEGTPSSPTVTVSSSRTAARPRNTLGRHSPTSSTRRKTHGSPSSR
ncbi:serine/threonine protein kinase [Streptomyces sp. SAJ15]|nr:serine/threonine protein kinase [Streptomyces sp. SAJ15]